MGKQPVGCDSLKELGGCSFGTVKNKGLGSILVIRTQNENSRTPL